MDPQRNVDFCESELVALEKAAMLLEIASEPKPLPSLRAIDDAISKTSAFVISSADQRHAEREVSWKPEGNEVDLEHVERKVSNEPEGCEVDQRHAEQKVSREPEGNAADQGGQVERKVSWEPGILFRKLKQKFDDHELVKKVRESHAANQLLVSNRGDLEHSKKLGESDGGIGLKAKANEPIKVEANTGGVLGYNNPVYHRAMDWKNKTRDESKKRTLESHCRHSMCDDDDNANLKDETFASVSVSAITLENIPAWAKRAPYVVIAAEGKPYSTPRAPSKGPYEWPDFTTEFDVRDVWTDLTVSIFSAKAGSELVAMEDEFVGKAFIPLSTIVLDKTQPWIRTLFSIRKGCIYEASLSVDFLPIEPHVRMYSRCVDGMPSTGLHRPTEPIGRAKFRIEIKLKAPLSRALFMAPPSRRTVLPSKDEPLNPALLHQRSMRLRSIIAQYSSTFETLVEGILAWKNPFATWIWLTLFAQITLFSPLYHLPFFIAICAVLGAYFVHLERKKAVDTAGSKQKRVIIFSDETTISPDLPQTIPAKIKALQQLASAVQVLLGAVASILERVYIALSWDDPFVSFLVSMMLLCVGFGISFVLMLLCEFAIVFRICLFSTGFFLHIPSSLQKSMRTKLVKSWHSRSSLMAWVLLSTSFSSSSTHPMPTEQSVEEILSDIGNAAQGHAHADHTFTKDEMRWAVTNLLKRIPDGPELDHRRIARAQAVDQ